MNNSIVGDFDLGESFQNGIDDLIGFLPAIIGVILLLLVGWILARIVKRLTTSLLDHIHFDETVARPPAGNYITRIIERPTHFVGKVAYWIVLLAFISFAISALGVPALTTIVNGIYAYIPNIIAAIIIFMVASAITIGAEAFVARVLPPGALAKLLGAIVPAIVMPIAIFMILNQLQIAKDIVNITYAALVGSVALGMALAFGLGGRGVAERILNQAYESAQKNSEVMKREAQMTAANTKNKAQQARRNIR